MHKENLYRTLKDRELLSQTPRPIGEILNPETKKTLFDMAHESSARREYLQSGISEPDGSKDQFGQKTGFLHSPGSDPKLLDQAYDELEEIERTWIKFYQDATAAGDVDSADFVEEVVLQYFGYTPDL